MPKKSLKVLPTKKVIRCSGLPRLFDCPASTLNPDQLTEVRSVTTAADLGTEIHSAIQRCVETGDLNLKKIERIFSKEDQERAHRLVLNGLMVVQQAKRDMKNPQFEVEVSFETARYLVTGHVDILDCFPDRAYVVDFKTGRTRDDHYHQMVGYAVGAWTKVGRPDKFTVFVAYAYLEDASDITTFELTAQDMKDWLRDLDALDQKMYQVNRRCVYCPLQNECKTFRSYLKGAILSLRSFNSAQEDRAPVPISIRTIDPETLSELSIAAKVADTMVKRWRDLVKDEVREHGPLSLGNGNEYVVKIRKNRVLLTNPAMKILARYCTPKALLSATKFDLNACLSAAVSSAKGPMKAVLRKKIENALEQKGAFVYNESAFLETINAKGKRWPMKKSPKPPKGAK